MYLLHYYTLYDTVISNAKHEGERSVVRISFQKTKIYRFIYTSTLYFYSFDASLTITTVGFNRHYCVCCHFPSPGAK